MMKLPKDFYTRTDTVKIARELLGKILCSDTNGIITKGKIVETEAYCGADDRGCHAFGRRFTNRTKIMYAEGGYAYVYLCYGIHYLFNVITNVKDEPHAVLIRAIEPVVGFEEILLRTSKEKIDGAIGAGPGLVSQCMGFTTKHTGISLVSDTIWIEDAGFKVAQKNIKAGARVGMNFSGPYKNIPWRFRIKDSAYVSKAK